MTPRIIPARAGFTVDGNPGRGADPDHPRSRGVYTRSRSRPRDSPGSSPLARGLLGRLYEDAYAVRIIPARAGFTVRIETEDRLVRDHPRSRGVYFGWVGEQ